MEFYDENKKGRIIYFENMVKGTVFEFEGEIYMKSDEVCESSINLRTGEMVYLSTGTQCHIVKARLHWEYEESGAA
jgi:hypothetical protein